MDSQKTVSALLATGLTQIELAALVPCGQSTISSLKNGTRGVRISHKLACRLEAVYDAVCGETTVDAVWHSGRAGAQKAPLVLPAGRKDAAVRTGRRSDK